MTELEQHVTIMPPAHQYIINAECIIAHGSWQAQPAHAACDSDGAPDSVQYDEG